MAGAVAGDEAGNSQIRDLIEDVDDPARDGAVGRAEGQRGGANADPIAIWLSEGLGVMGGHHVCRDGCEEVAEANACVALVVLVDYENLGVLEVAGDVHSVTGLQQLGN